MTGKPKQHIKILKHKSEPYNSYEMEETLFKTASIGEFTGPVGWAK